MVRYVGGEPTALLLLRLVWKHLWNEYPDPKIEEACVIAATTPPRGRRVIGMPRGARKTAMGMVICLDRLDEDRQSTHLWLSAGKNLPADICRWHKEVIKALRPLHSLLPGPGQRNGDYEFDIGGSTSKKGKDPSLFSAGIGSSIAGRHPKHIYLDDVESKNNSETTVQRGRLAYYSLEPENLTADIPDATQLAFQTPHVIDSIIHQYEKAGFEIFLCPQRFPNAASVYQVPKLFPSLKEALKEDPSLASGGGIAGNLGKPTIPSRWNEQYCREKQVRSRSLLEYRLQQLLDTRVDGGTRYPIRCSNMPVMDLQGSVDYAPGEKVLHGSDLESCRLSELPCVGHDGDGWYRPQAVLGVPQKWQRKFLTLDPAHGGGDEVGYAAGGCSSGHVYLLEGFGLDGGWSESNLRLFAAIAVRWKVDAVVVEDTYSDPEQGQLAARLLQPYVYRAAQDAGLSIAVVAEKAQASKGKRILDAMMRLTEQHRFIVNRSVVLRDYYERKANLPDEEQQDYQLFFQLTHLDVQDEKCEDIAHDDRADAVEKLVRRCIALMGEDRDLAMEKRQEERRYRLQMEFSARARRRHGFGQESRMDRILD